MVAVDDPAVVSAASNHPVVYAPPDIGRSLNSGEQARADSSYFDIRLVMEPIWEDRTDGRWLYVEQAVAGHEVRP